ESNLHIGSGEEKSIADEESLYNEWVVDANGLPYIPASSLRGWLRSRIENLDICKKLFGLARQKAESDDAGNSGHARIYDALINREHPMARILSRTSIDPLTAAAKEHHLASHRVIEPGAEFSVHIELDHPEKAESEALLGALAGFGTASDWRLGQGKSIGQGKLSWQLGEVRVLRKENLKQWLRKSSIAASRPQQRRARYRKLDVFDRMEHNQNALLDFFKVETFSVQYPLSKWDSRELALQVESPILINDPERVKAREKQYEILKSELLGDKTPQSFEELKQRIDASISLLKDFDDPRWVCEIRSHLVAFRTHCDKCEDPHNKTVLKELFDQVLNQFHKPNLPDEMYMRHRQGACIPGSTLKGWVRGQCRKILLTLQDVKDDKTVDGMLNEIFGDTDRDPQRVRFDDALSDVDEEKELHAQTFNAVDRFTGGVKPGALFNVEAIWPKAFRGTIHYRAERLEDWMKILLLYVLRDAEEGDLVLGWGKSKGYGRLTLKPMFKYLDSLHESTLELWHDLLLHRLNQKEAA
ncbi:MAG: RAMP superfamily CRISPR-associated protein, partial [Methylococcales bacterium]